jgi:hypothetical protein
MKKNVIEFSKDGSSFSFNFANGSESFEIDSKEAGFKAISELAQKSKITVEEFGEFCDQILKAENLPWSDSMQKVMVVIGGGDFLDFLLGLLEDINPYEPVEIAYFNKCKCGENHGHIYFVDGCSTMLEGKAEALSVLDTLKVEGHVSLEEYAKVKAEIEKELSK